MMWQRHPLRGIFALLCGETLIAVAVASMMALSWLIHRNSNDQTLAEVVYRSNALWCSGRGDRQSRAAGGIATTPDPEQFAGSTKDAYRFARQNPALLAKLHCYCGCDQIDGHKNLLDCFRGYHGAWCDVGTSEALEAEILSASGNPADQIKEFLRQRFAAPK